MTVSNPTAPLDNQTYLAGITQLCAAIGRNIELLTTATLLSSMSPVINATTASRIMVDCAKAVVARAQDHTGTKP